MSQYTAERLHQFLTSRPGGEKLLVVPGQWAGDQLLEQYIRRYGGVLGLRVHTPGSLAQEVCVLGRGCRPLLREDAAAALVLGLLRENRPEYFQRLGERCVSLSTARELLRCFRKLRGRDCADTPRLAALDQLYRAYQAEKGARGLWDREDLFAAALEELERKPLDVPTALCSNTASQGAAQTFLERVAQDAVVLPVPAAGEAVQALELFLPQEAGEIRAERRFVQGYGVSNEALFPFYDLLEREIPFGQAAILYTDPACVPLLQGHAARLGIPLTLAEGVPLGEGPLLTALKDLERWCKTGCPVEGLARLAENGLRPAHSGALLRMLRRSGDLTRLDLPQEGETPEQAERRTAWRTFFQRSEELFRPESEAREGLESLRAFLRDYYSRTPLQAGECALLTAQGEGLLDGCQGGRFQDLWPLLLDCAAQAAWQSARPQDGAVHSAPLSKGLFLDRPHTYILGLGRDSLTPPDQESPLLTNQECWAMGLPEWGAERQTPLQLLSLVLADAEGELVLSYPSFDTERILPLPPAPIYEQLRDGKPATTFSYRRPCALTAADRWLEEGSPAQAPAFARTEPGDLSDFLRSHVFSATALELGLECPRRFYFQYVLGLPQPYQPLPEDRWLAPNELGNLVHQALEDYFGTLAAGQTPDLEQIWASRLEQARRTRPSTRASLVEADRKKAEGMFRQAVEYFQREQSQNVPLGAELTFGRAGASPARTPFPLPEEFELKLDGLSFRFTGSVDRLDQLPSGHLLIVDYKTGSPARFLREWEHKLQYYLYAAAVEQLSGTRVEQAVYLLLGQNGVRPVSVTRPLDQTACLARLRALLEVLSHEKTITLAQPEWDGEHLVEGEAEARQARLESCARYCPYARICQEVRP